MAAEGMLSVSVESVVEDVIRQQENRLNDIDFASRREEEDSLRRYEAAEWLRKIVGVVVSKDLPAQPSELDFRLGLRSGIILCTAINKVQPGSIPKVVDAGNDIGIVPDGAALMAYQYFENLRNFLRAVEEMGLPTFDASDLEQGGKTARVVNCVLALKAFNDRKNGSGSCKGNSKTSSVGKAIVRKNSEPFMHSISRTSSVSERSVDTLGNDQYSDLDYSDMSNPRSLNMMIRALLVDKKPEEIPHIVENMLTKVMEEFERRLTSQPESVKTTPETMSVSGQNMSPTESPKAEAQGQNISPTESPKREARGQNMSPTESPKAEALSEDGAATELVSEAERFSEEEKGHQYIPCVTADNQSLKKQKMLVEQQNSHIQELKLTIHATKESMNLLQMKYQKEFAYLGKQLHSIASAASGYRKVLEENRKLYNQVQDLKGNIRVYCRVRPFLPGQASGFSTVDHIEDGNIAILTPSKNGKDARKSFTFNKVFGPTATQAEVFADMQPLVRSVLDGYNVCIFAYGQTGSGKTFTMTGPNNLTEETYGVNYRALNDLFLLAEQRKATIMYEVFVQMMEIYNEQVRDLLATDGSIKKLEIRNSSQNGINVPDANRLPVSTTADVINLMNLGHKNRSVCSTAMNDRSSRSHSCMTVHVQGKDLTSGATIRGCMHLVDLAGSERVDKSEVTGDRLKEAQHINKSLAALGDVIASLASKNTHVPYRNSKLTQLLQDALGGQAKTLMFIHMSPEADALVETLSTLKFAERVATVELGAARANKDGSDVKDLKEQIASLKVALARKDDEMEQMSISLSSTPETLSVKSVSTASSPVHPIWRTTKDTSSGARKSPPKDVANKAKTTSTQKPRRQSLDPDDILSNDAHWPPLSVVKGGEKIRTSGEWIEKVMTKTSEAELDNQDCEVRNIRYGSATPDEMDELDTANSDSSEPDVQVNIPRVSSLPAEMGSKIKKPQAKAPKTKSPEKKSLIPTAPSRRSSNGPSSPVVKKSANVKRKTGNAK